MAMFVLVVDTSLMNVSISAVVQDLGTTVSAVQSVIALEALAGLSLALLSLTMFAVALFAVAMLAGSKAGRRRPAGIIRWGFLLLSIGMVVLIVVVPQGDSGWWLLGPLVIAGAGLGLLVSQLNNYTLAPITGEKLSEAAGINSAAGSFGLAFAGAILPSALSIGFTSIANSSTAFTTAQQQQVAAALETDPG